MIGVSASKKNEGLSLMKRWNEAGRTSDYWFFIDQMMHPHPEMIQSLYEAPSEDGCVSSCVSVNVYNDEKPKAVSHPR